MKEREYKKIHVDLIICAEEKEEIHQKVKEICHRLVGDLLQIGSGVVGEGVEKGMNEDGVVRSKK